MKNSKRIAFPQIETLTNVAGFVAYTEYRRQPVTQYGQSAQEAEAKVRQYIEAHYAMWPEARR